MNLFAYFASLKKDKLRDKIFPFKKNRDNNLRKSAQTIRENQREIKRKNLRETKKKNTPQETRKNKKNTHMLGSEFIRFLCYLKKDK